MAGLDIFAGRLRSSQVPIQIPTRLARVEKAELEPEVQVVLTCFPQSKEVFPEAGKISAKFDVFRLKLLCFRFGLT